MKQLNIVIWSTQIDFLMLLSSNMAQNLTYNFICLGYFAVLDHAARTEDIITVLQGISQRGLLIRSV